MQNKGLKTDIQPIQEEEIYDNTNDSTIKITKSKAELLYREYMEAPTKTAIVSNLGLVIAFITPLLTSDFKNTWSIPSEAFRDFFIAASAISFYKLLKSIIQYVSKGRSLNTENFIRELCGGEKETVSKKKRRQRDQKEAIYKRGLLKGYKMGKRAK